MIVFKIRHDHEWTVNGVLQIAGVTFGRSKFWQDLRSINLDIQQLLIQSFGFVIKFSQGFKKNRVFI